MDRVRAEEVIISPDEQSEPDRRDAKGQMAVFTADAHFVVYMNAMDRPHKN
jgi:hypothetical protein